MELEPSTGCNVYTGSTTQEPDSCLLDACVLQRSNPRIFKSTNHLLKVPVLTVGQISVLPKPPL